MALRAIASPAAAALAVVAITENAVAKSPITESVSAEVCVLMGSPKEAEIARRAISVGERPGKSSAAASAEGETLTLKISADDIGALRATLNSMLREVKIASDSMIFDSDAVVCVNKNCDNKKNKKPNCDNKKNRRSK